MKTIASSPYKVTVRKATLLDSVTRDLESAKQVAAFTDDTADSRTQAERWLALVIYPALYAVSEIVDGFDDDLDFDTFCDIDDVDFVNDWIAAVHELNPAWRVLGDVSGEADEQEKKDD